MLESSSLCSSGQGGLGWFSSNLASRLWLGTHCYFACFPAAPGIEQTVSDLSARVIAYAAPCTRISTLSDQLHGPNCSPLLSTWTCPRAQNAVLRALQRRQRDSQICKGWHWRLHLDESAARCRILWEQHCYWDSTVVIYKAKRSFIKCVVLNIIQSANSHWKLPPQQIDWTIKTSWHSTPCLSTPGKQIGRENKSLL